MGDRKKKKDLKDLDIEQQEAAEVKGGTHPHGHREPHVHAPSLSTKKMKAMKDKIEDTGGSTRLDP
ncbi:MAG: hypothetical protein ACRDH6_02860 [Actinomycetota bacterium]